MLGLAASAALTGCSTPAGETAAPQPAAPEVESPFVGQYDGSSFETYMAMRIVDDGTFEWVLAVGALDMRSQGSWTERDGVVHFTTEPTPVPAEFRFVRFEPVPEDAEADKLVHVFLPDGKPFTNAETSIECANDVIIHQFVAGSNAYLQGYEPDECDTPIAVIVRQGNYDVTSPRYDLAEMGWQEGQIVHVEFAPNDIGVLDLTGMRGTLIDGVLRVDGPLGREEFRKLPPRPDSAP